MGTRQPDSEEGNMEYAWLRRLDVLANGGQFEGDGR